MKIFKKIISQLKDGLTDVTQGYNTTGKGTTTIVKETKQSSFVQNLFSKGATNLETFGNPLGKFGQALMGYVSAGEAQQSRMRQEQTSTYFGGSLTSSSLTQYIPLAIGGVLIYNLIKK